MTEAFAHPIPYRRHVGEEAEVAERGALRGEADVVPGEGPAFARDGPGVLPAAAAVLVGAGDELAIGIPLGKSRGPQCLTFGAAEAVAAVAFELPALAAVDKPVIGPALALHD